MNLEIQLNGKRILPYVDICNDNSEQIMNYARVYTKTIFRKYNIIKEIFIPNFQNHNIINFIGKPKSKWQLFKELFNKRKSY